VKDKQLWCGTNDLINRILGITKYLGLASWLGVITVLGSSIALMNIMIVSVTERTRNRRSESFRAKKTTIAIQFFIETLLIGQMGGLCRYYGILIGFGIATAMDFAFVILGKSWLPLSPVYSCYCL
jgi:putative ABC transport system permease protein